jgi:hypothetical protein
MMSVRLSVVKGDEVLQQAASGFEVTSTAACERKVEVSVNDKLAAMAETVS